jgi:hypothetical protein
MKQRVPNHRKLKHSQITRNREQQITENRKLTVNNNSEKENHRKQKIHNHYKQREQITGYRDYQITRNNE